MTRATPPRTRSSSSARASEGRSRSGRPSPSPVSSASSGRAARRTNLTTTEIVSPVVTPGGPGAPIAPTVLGLGGRTPPTTVIDDDATGDVETSGTFDPATDGIDFYESLEAMLLRVNDPVVVGPTNGFGELWVLADDGAGAERPHGREGIVVRPTDFNPERIQLDDEIVGWARRRTRTSATASRRPRSACSTTTSATSSSCSRVPLTRVDGGLVREVDASAGGRRARDRDLQRREPLAGRSARRSSPGSPA